MCDFTPFIQKLAELPPTFPHASNIHTKIRRRLNQRQTRALQIVRQHYLPILEHAQNQTNNLNAWIDQHTSLINNYIEVLNQPECRAFSHQSDFKSSVLPEFICCLFKQIVRASGLNLHIEAQKDIIIDFIFTHQNSGFLFPKNKRVDAAILLPSTLSFNDSEIERFAIPIISIEVKTNLDKNMITGIEHSVEKLKSTFPLCKYFVVTELSDFAIESQNYARTFIDEIFILRKQKRSNYRKSGVANGFCSELIKSFSNSIIEGINTVNAEIQSVQDKYSTGTLISE